MIGRRVTKNHRFDVVRTATILIIKYTDCCGTLNQFKFHRGFVKTNSLTFLDGPQHVDNVHGLSVFGQSNTQS